MRVLEIGDLVDPVSKQPLELTSYLLHPSYGRTWYGILRAQGRQVAYPITEGVLRIYAPLRQEEARWVEGLGFTTPLPGGGAFQEQASVGSFGLEWAFDPSPRNDDDLKWRILDRFGLDPTHLDGKLVLDAGCGAGDQSRYFLDHGARAVSVDLSSAIDIASRKLSKCSAWLGIQGDIAALPLRDGIVDFVYCEGVLQHTRDSAAAVRELWRVLKPGGRIAATHYTAPTGLLRIAKHGLHRRLRAILSRWEPTHLLAFTAFLSVLAYVPVLGYALRKAGIVLYNPRIPAFKATWSCNYDSYGSHAYQRHIHPKEFFGYFEQLTDLKPLLLSDTECVLYLEKSI